MLYRCKKCHFEADVDSCDLSSGHCPGCGERYPGIFAGCSVADFSVIGELARGANGVVYLARCPLLERHVALKLILKDLSEDVENVTQFFIEARAAARLEHPNIIRALDAGVDENDVCYFAMELIEGGTVENYLDQYGALDFARALYIGTRIAEAFTYTWRRVRMVHGDIKPANIMLDKNGEPKLGDLGQAKFGDSGFDLDNLMATPLYMPPEIARGEYEKIGAKTDIYSFGATLYEMFAGEPPLFSNDMDEITRMQLYEKPPSLSQRLGFFDQELSNFVDRMLAKNPELRPDSWHEVSEFLRKIELRTQHARLR